MGPPRRVWVSCGRPSTRRAPSPPGMPPVSTTGPRSSSSPASPRPRSWVFQAAGAPSWPSPVPVSILPSWAPGPSLPPPSAWRRPAGPPADLDLVEANEAFAAQALCRRPGHGPGPGPRSTSTAALSPSVIPSVPRAPGCWFPCSTRCSAAMPRRFWRRLCIGGGQGVALAVERV